MFAGTRDLLPCLRVMGWVSGQGWQSHRPVRENAGCTCSCLCLCSKREPQALFPAPHSLVSCLLKQQEADCQQEHFGAVCNWDRTAPLPPAAKGLLHSNTSHPFLRERASQQSVLHPVGMCWMPTQQTASTSQAGWGCSTTLLPG